VKTLSLLKILNPLLALLLLGQLSTGLLHGLMTRDQFALVHKAGAIALAAAALLHLTLNWNWVRNSYVPRNPRTPPASASKPS
jgi:hypothetical protein